jgi:MinD superfamily P-loop ATPase
VSRFVLAVASGKGGTGKTTLSVALAMALAGTHDVTLLDADVEAPNGHLFLRLEWTGDEPLSRLVPTFDEERCDGCGICREVCAFRAIVVLGGSPLLFPELCASCGACARLCPSNAIREQEHEIGRLEAGHAGTLRFVQGRLNVGEARAVPVVDAVVRHAHDSGTFVIDAAPGTSCPVIAAVRGADYLLLVTEPTRFGLNDLELAVEMARALGLPHGVVINRADLGDDKVQEYCRREGIPILLEIPFDRAVAETCATGGTLLDVRPELAQTLRTLFEHVRKEVAP